MSFRTKLVIGVMVAVSLAVLLLWLEETGTRIMAALAFLFSTANIAYGFWEKHRDAIAKEQENQERVEVKLGVGKVRLGTMYDTPVLEVVLFNPSNVNPLRIKSVRLCYEWNGQDVEELLPTFQTKWEERTIDVDIAPKKSSTYIFCDSKHPQAVSKSPLEKIRLVISSHAGEIKVINGEQIKSLVMEMKKTR